MFSVEILHFCFLNVEVRKFLNTRCSTQLDVRKYLLLLFWSFHKVIVHFEICPPPTTPVPKTGILTENKIWNFNKTEVYSVFFKIGSQVQKYLRFYAKLPKKKFKILQKMKKPHKINANLDKTLRFSANLQKKKL